MSTGVAAITIEARQTAPEQVDTAGWEEVVEVSMGRYADEIRRAAATERNQHH